MTAPSAKAIRPSFHRLASVVLVSVGVTFLVLYLLSKFVSGGDHSVWVSVLFALAIGTWQVFRNVRTCRLEFGPTWLSGPSPSFRRQVRIEHEELGGFESFGRRGMKLRGSGGEEILILLGHYADNDAPMIRTKVAEALGTTSATLPA